MKKILFVLLLSISTFVHAEWTPVEFNEIVIAYVDKTTIQAINKNKRAWIRIEFLKSERQKSARSLVEFDCLEKKLRFINYESFNQSNLIEPRNYSNVIQPWDFYPPGSVFLAILDVVCKSK
jgi:hypothetical protein